MLGKTQRQANTTSLFEKENKTLKQFCLTETLEINKEHNYYQQIQGCLYAADTDWCDFVVWTLRDMHICKIPKDAAWLCNIEILEKFYFEHLLPNCY